jgi:hypothetical protein
MWKLVPSIHGMNPCKTSLLGKRIGFGCEKYKEKVGLRRPDIFKCWLSSPLNFEKKTLEKIDFLMLFVLFCAFKTSTIDFVHFYDIITAENWVPTNPLKNFYNRKIIFFALTPVVTDNFWSRSDFWSCVTRRLKSSIFFYQWNSISKTFTISIAGVRIPFMLS